MKKPFVSCTRAVPAINPLEEWELASYADKRLKTSQLFAGSFLGPPLVLGQGRQALSMSDEAGRDRCTALWKTYSVKCTTEEEEETEFEEDRKRGSSGSIRQTYPGHVVRVKMRRETTGSPAKGRQEHLV